MWEAAVSFGAYHGSMESLRTTIRSLAEFWGEAAAETLWPTRCAICDYPGDVLCARCRRRLPYLDQWRACRRCGAPYGLLQCTECNPVILAHLGREELPYAWCASATMFDQGSTGRLVRVFKDQGEQRLATIMALLMVRALPYGCRFDAVAYVPATRSAYRTRGYDHARLLAEGIARLCDVPVLAVLDRPKTSDQRALGRAERIANLAGRFHALSHVKLPAHVLLVDDVYTTGATLCSAADALLKAGAETVGCCTFTRA